MSNRFRVELLSKHDRSRFDCGVEDLNRYLTAQASQDVRRRVTACYLLIEVETNRLAGFYTLAAGSVLLDEIPIDKQKKLPRYPTVPVIRMGRLAIDTAFQGQKLGGVLLYDAVQRIANNAEIGAYALVVDAKDDRAAAFYKHHGFIATSSLPLVLFLPIHDAMKQTRQ